LLDCSGLTITAGFWNSHVHFFERKWANAAEIPAPELGRQLQDMLTRFGFTSVFDTGSLWENTRRIRERVELGEVAGPRIRSTGEGLVPPGAMPSDTVLYMMGLMKFPAPEIADDEQAAAAARKLLGEGVDAIKLFASSPRSARLPESAMMAAAREAHQAGKLVFVHPNSGADVLAAVRSGVDIVAHTTPHSGPWDEEILRAMREHRVALTPTLTLWNYYARHDRISVQEQIARTAVGQLKAWIECGGTVLFGTDLGAVEYDPGAEYRLMAEAGMGFREILQSLTTAPAERFGETTRLGRVAVGLDADLVVLRGDPGADLGALTAVECTLRGGEMIYSAGDSFS
jgi:imidazolonepropionase-like amidohydrolase